jgi:hypothetical protein
MFRQFANIDHLGSTERTNLPVHGANVLRVSAGLWPTFDFYPRHFHRGCLIFALSAMVGADAASVRYDTLCGVTNPLAQGIPPVEFIQQRSS